MPLFSGWREASASLTAAKVRLFFGEVGFVEEIKEIVGLF
jgi:hypothetical protein